MATLRASPEGTGGGLCPLRPPHRQRRVKTRSTGLTLSDLVRRSVGRVHTWTVAHADVERERTQQVAPIGNNLNQIAHWANTHKGAIEVIAHLIAIKRGLASLTPAECPDADAD